MSLVDATAIRHQEPRRLRNGAVAGEPKGGENAHAEGLEGDSAAMRLVQSIAKRLAQPGYGRANRRERCGKEMVARALHRASRVRGEFVVVNCAAAPESLLESQFFRDGAGPFTAAAANRGFCPRSLPRGRTDRVRNEP